MHGTFLRFTNLDRAQAILGGDQSRGPLLLTAGGADHTVPPAVVKSTLKQYGKSSAITELKEFPGRGHSLALDGAWHDVADAVLAWLKEHSL